jgi:hypothetical protein
MNVQVLYLAILDNEKNKAQKLIAKGVNINAEAFANVPVLHAIILSKKLRAVKLALELGADPDLKDAEGFGPIHYALDHKLYKIAACLLEKGANPLLRDPNEWPAFIMPETGVEVDPLLFARSCLEEPETCPQYIYPFGHSQQDEGEHVHSEHCSHAHH